MEEKRIIKGVAINDLHFGIKDSARLYNELKQFTKFLKENEVDILMINGDYFDCRLSFMDTASYYAISFFNELISIVKEKKIILRMIQGTMSHDLNQLQIFKSYETDPDLNFKIYSSVTEETILGLNILFVPEEYPEDSDAYYKEFKEKQYHIMAVHGTMDFVAQPGVVENSKRSTHSAPVFIWKEWKPALSKGFITAGHIHGRNVYSNKIYYSGAFSRWSYGERSERGFTYFEYDLENEKYEVKFIDNTEAPIFSVYTMKELIETLNESTTAEEVKAVIESICNNDKDYNRFDLSGLSGETIGILRKAYCENPRIKFEIDNSKPILISESKKTEEEDFAKWHYITKRELPLDKTIKRFAKEELGKELTLKQIDEALADKE